MTYRITDCDLVSRLQQGDLEALGSLFDRHQRLVYCTALGIVGDAEAAADILQDTFLRLHRFAHRIDTKRPLEPWLYRVTANLAYTWVKRRTRFVRRLAEMAEWLLRDRKPTLDEMAEVDDTWQRVQKAVLSLPLTHRLVVVLYYLNDLSVEEIGGILDIPVGTVKSRLHYGRKLLKRQLGLEQELVTGAWYEAT